MNKAPLEGGVMKPFSKEDIGDGYFAGGKTEAMDTGSAYGKSVYDSFAPSSFAVAEQGGLGVSFGDIFGGLIGGVTKLFGGGNTDNNSLAVLQAQMQQAQMQAQQQAQSNKITYGLLGAVAAGLVVYLIVKKR